ncbi:MAG: hypothetical protein S4CHLAM20_05940 [Chlamydiia bacterium]|nr:hypothetical protein [Chlamydiia bacterium]
MEITQSNLNNNLTAQRVGAFFLQPWSARLVPDSEKHANILRAIITIAAIVITGGLALIFFAIYGLSQIHNANLTNETEEPTQSPEKINANEIPPHKNKDKFVQAINILRNSVYGLDDYFDSLLVLYNSNKNDKTVILGKITEIKRKAHSHYIRIIVPILYSNSKYDLEKELGSLLQEIMRFKHNCEFTFSDSDDNSYERQFIRRLIGDLPITNILVDGGYTSD